MSMLFISHDLGRGRARSPTSVVVMRNGEVREQGAAAQIFAAPQDAYTRALLACRPRLDAARAARLPVIDDYHRTAGRWRHRAARARLAAGRRAAARGDRPGQELLAPRRPVRRKRDSRR